MKPASGTLSGTLSGVEASQRSTAQTLDGLRPDMAEIKADDQRIAQTVDKLETNE